MIQKRHLLQIGLILQLLASFAFAQTEALLNATPNANAPAATNQDLAQLNRLRKVGDPTPGQVAPKTEEQNRLAALMQLQQKQQAELKSQQTGFPVTQEASQPEKKDSGPEMIVSGRDLIGESAFRSTLDTAFPLSSDQIVRMRKKYEQTELATAQDATTPPKPTATSQMVSLAPGTTPPVIRLAQGFVTSLVFLDSTGAEWPIVAYDLGNPTAFNIQWDRKSNTLMIQASQLYTYGNLAVRLKDLTTPVMLTLIPGQKAVDYRVDLRIEGLGPNATQLPMGSGLPTSANPLLLTILEGVPPPGGKELTVMGGVAQIWKTQDRMFVRTRTTILSPGWLSTMSSPDGMHAYEMPQSPVILVSDQGKVVQLKLKGF